MRTPNSQCVICEKPLYRRPNELHRVRYTACLAHRDEAKRRFGLTDQERAALAKGTVKGQNYRTGYRHRDETKAKIRAATRAFWASRAEEATLRGAKIRGERHYAWKGGVTKLNLSIRRMTEYRKWAAAVFCRDQRCVDCGSEHNLEADHVRGLAELLVHYGVTTREDARVCVALWDVSNGRLLCEVCHYGRHRRTLPTPVERRRAAVRECECCGNAVKVKPSQLKNGRGRFCGIACYKSSRRTQKADRSLHANQRTSLPAVAHASPGDV